MFLFRNKQPFYELLNGYYDIHSHLLPGVDDGCAATDQSDELLVKLEALGVKGMWFTPHIMADIYPLNAKERLEGVFANFVNKSSIDIRLGAEYMVDDSIIKHFDVSPLMLGENSVMIEFASGLPQQAFDTIFDISIKGYSVILAHPERYLFLNNNGLKLLTRLENAGCLLQLNIGSLSGVYGRGIQRFAMTLLKEERYSYAGTDLHNSNQLDMLCKMKFDRSTIKLLEPVMERNARLYR